MPCGSNRPPGSRQEQDEPYNLRRNLELIDQVQDQLNLNAGVKMIAAGTKAPEFKLPDQDGVVHKLSDYRGKPVVLYFYPKDDTPGCTREACSFRDNFAEFKKAGVEVLGISVDDSASHTRFRKKYNLPFTLLSDADKKVVQDYGVWVEKKNYGKKYWGTARTTFLIDKNGDIIHVFRNVKPDEHAREVLEKLSG
jgi:peroxiredoxin Q/BCP